MQQPFVSNPRNTINLFEQSWTKNRQKSGIFGSKGESLKVICPSTSLLFGCSASLNYTKPTIQSDLWWLTTLTLPFASQNTGTKKWKLQSEVYADDSSLWQFSHVPIISNLRSPPPLSKTHTYKIFLHFSDIYISSYPSFQNLRKPSPFPSTGLRKVPSSPSYRGSGIRNYVGNMKEI